MANKQIRINSVDELDKYKALIKVTSEKTAFVNKNVYHSTN